jgi:hypothetical protein
MLACWHDRRWFSTLLAVSLVSALSFARPAFAQEEKEEIEDTQDKDQPPVTAGGLYTIETFPRSEHARTLTLPQGILEFIGEIGFDLSEGRAFKTFNPVIGARYGLSDTFQVEAGADLSFSSFESPGLGKFGVGNSSIAPADTIALWAAAEIALSYDLVDARVALFVPVDPDFLLDIAVGLPFKFRLNEKIAIMGLEEILIIHTADGADVDGDVDTPDLQISAAGLLQVIEPLAVIVRATLFVGAFKFSDQRRLPVDLDVQYSVSNQFDIGIGVSLTNLAPPENQGNPTDERAFRVWGRFRI